MVDLLPAVDSDGGKIECLPVVVFDQHGNATGGGLDSLGYTQTPLTTTSAFTVIPPPGTAYFLARVEAADARWRDDGVDPTPAIGVPLLQGETLVYDAMSATAFIAQATGAILNIVFYGDADA